MSAIALDDVELYAIERPQFVAAVTGFGSSGTLAAATIAQHLEHAPGV
jgi:hypothetical protein